MANASINLLLQIRGAKKMHAFIPGNYLLNIRLLLSGLGVSGRDIVTPFQRADLD